MESNTARLTEALRLLGQGEQAKAMQIAEEVQTSSGVLGEEDSQDIASIFYANKAYDKAIEALETHEGLESLVLKGRILFDKGSHKEASLAYISAEQALSSFNGQSKASLSRDVAIGMNKCTIELNQRTSVGDVNRYAFLAEAG